MLAIACALLATACGARTELRAPEPGLDPCNDAGTGATRACETICGTGLETCVQGYWQNCTAPKPLPPELAGVVRDFRDSHPDFETGILGNDRGIVEPVLGADGLPVFAGRTPTTTTREAFDQWFRDVPGVNAPVELTLPLTPRSGSAAFAFDDDDFFPIDGRLFGNEGRAHNFHFTFASAARFRYRGGERFSFEGDDDVWVFVNRRLAVDLGGVHSSERATADLDAQADALAISVGGVYELHFFFAERQTTGSTFHVQTSISEFDRCE